MTGLFETILVRDSAPVLLDPHLDRLRRSAGALDVPGLPAPGRLRAECVSAAASCGGALGRMRVALQGGEASVAVEPFPGYPAELYESGAAALLAAEPGHPLGARAGHKVLPYTPLLSRREEARRAGAFELILVARDGALLEGCASNLFVVLGGEVRTPPLTRPILPGVTRAAAIVAAREEGLTVREADVFRDDLETAEEAFLTGALMEAVPLAEIGGRVLPRVGGVGRRVFERLHRRR